MSTEREIARYLPNHLPPSLASCPPAHPNLPVRQEHTRVACRQTPATADEASWSIGESETASNCVPLPVPKVTTTNNDDNNEPTHPPSHRATRHTPPHQIPHPHTHNTMAKPRTVTPSAAAAAKPPPVTAQQHQPVAVAPPAPAPAAAIKSKSSGPGSASSWDQAVVNLTKHYQKATPQRTKLIDAFLGFLVAVGVLQFVYCVLAGNYVRFLLP